jgi:hypothetical protein
VVPRGALVVEVDNVLAIEKMLYAVLQLLDEASISAKDVSIIAVAKFPIHYS